MKLLTIIEGMILFKKSIIKILSMNAKVLKNLPDTPMSQKIAF